MASRQKVLRWIVCSDHKDGKLQAICPGVLLWSFLAPSALSSLASQTRRNHGIAVPKTRCAHCATHILRYLEARIHSFADLRVRAFCRGCSGLAHDATLRDTWNTTFAAAKQKDAGLPEHVRTAVLRPYWCKWGYSLSIDSSRFCFSCMGQVVWGFWCRYVLDRMQTLVQPRAFNSVVDHDDTCME